MNKVSAYLPIISLIVFCLITFSPALSISATTTYTDKVLDDIVKEKGRVKFGIIVDIKDSDSSEGENRELADAITSKMQGELLKSIPKDKRDKLMIVERTYLDKILEEQKLSLSGLTESETVKLGKIAGIDILLLFVFHKNHLTSKLLVVNTGEILQSEVLDIETFKEETRLRVLRDGKKILLANHNFSVRASSSTHYEWKLQKGTILQISFNSNLDINVWLLDYPEYQKFNNGEAFNYYTAASGKRIYNSNFEVVIPKTGTYCFVFDNKFSILTPKKVSIKAIAIVPQ